MRDYTNKTVYLGMDIHKKTYSVTAICDGQVIKKDTFKASPKGLIAYCKKYYEGAKIESTYEAGFCGFHLHRCLEAAGIKNMVVHAAGIEIAVGDRVKTDKRDSLKLATHLAAGRLKGIHVPSLEREDKRNVTRLRDTFVGERSRLACQMKSLLHLNGLIAADSKKKISIKWIKELKATEFSNGLKFTLEQYANLWLYINAQIKLIDKEIEKQAQEERELEMIYRSVPGIGPTSARVLANELDDLLHFRNERRIFSYAGLTPSEYSSGERVQQGHVTRQGKPILRKILVQAAWMAVRLDPSLGAIFSRIAVRAGKKKAIIAIARKLLGRIRACFRTGELYRVCNESSNNQEAILATC